MINSMARSLVTAKKWYRNISAGNPQYSDMELISTTILGTASTGTIVFDNIPQGFKHLQLRISARAANGGNNYEYIFMRVNNVGTATYSQHDLYGNGSSVASQALASNSGGTGGYVTGSASTSNDFGASIVDILDYTSTSKNKTWRGLSGRAGGNNLIMLSSSALYSTSAITRIDLLIIYGTLFAAGSRFSLYGIKG